jgi:uncharacterized damage-inducible protein DinB
MDEKSLLVQFWEKESPATRKVISRIPQETSDYKADPKARTAREIAWLLVMEEKLLAEGLERGEVEWQEGDVPATVAEILDTYDKHHDASIARLKALDESGFAKEIPMTYEGKEVFRMTGYHLAWEFLFDRIHHRGQLSTYLRPMGSTVPSIYGPTADEPM